MNLRISPTGWSPHVDFDKSRIPNEKGDRPGHSGGLVIKIRKKKNNNGLSKNSETIFSHFF